MKDAFHSFYKCILWNFTSNTIMPNLECPYFIGFEQNFGSQIWQNWSPEFCKIQLTELSNILVKYDYAEFRTPTFRRNYISPEGYLPDGEMWFSEPLVDWYEQYWSPGHWRTSFPPHPCTANRHGLTHHDSEVQRMRIFSFILWYLGRGRATYAPVLLISVYEGFGEPHLPVRWVTLRGNIISNATC